jgi:glutathione synthase/RimK-type ligase-like ATP-grasp enzyme
MPKCVLLSCEDLTDFVVDDDLLLEPFKQQGWDTEFVPWSAQGVDWRAYDAAIIRATWDYTHHLAPFLAVLRDIEAAGVPLFNPYRVIEWNAHKKYLIELEAKGVPIVPTRVYSQVHDVPLESLFDAFATDELIIKPMVSAGAIKTYRFTQEQLPGLRDRFNTELDGLDLMVQPFVDSLLRQGEYSLFYFNGVLSHTIVKEPQPGDFRVQEEWGGIINPTQPTPDMLAVGEAVLAVLPEVCLYARVDIVQADNGQWQVMEVELIEPSLYFRMNEQSPARFVQAFLERVCK